jgi:hypothetical protein
MSSSSSKAISVKDIGKLLEELNVEYSQGRLCRLHSMYKPHIVEKCKKYNMWLFIERIIPFEHVEKELHSSTK